MLQSYSGSCCVIIFIRCQSGTIWGQSHIGGERACVSADFFNMSIWLKKMTKRTSPSWRSVGAWMLVQLRLDKPKSWMSTCLLSGAAKRVIGDIGPAHPWRPKCLNIYSLMLSCQQDKVTVMAMHLHKPKSSWQQTTETSVKEKFLFFSEGGGDQNKTELWRLAIKSKGNKKIKHYTVVSFCILKIMLLSCLKASTGPNLVAVEWTKDQFSQHPVLVFPLQTKQEHKSESRMAV